MNFIETSRSQFQAYKALADKAMAQLSDESLLRPSDNESTNSLVTIIQHMRGNMLSRWTNLLQEDGEKPWRTRDAEFEYHPVDRQGLMQLWEEGWDCVFSTLATLNTRDLDKTIHIRGEGMSAMDGIIRQLMHYAYHVGQIILICKDNLKENWQSLSIPKGKTAEFNAAFIATHTAGKA